MPTRDELKAKYGGKLSAAVNRAIRAEIPGGAELLDAAAAMIPAGARGQPHPHAAAIAAALPTINAARDTLANGILRHYGGEAKRDEASD